MHLKISNHSHPCRRQEAHCNLLRDMQCHPKSHSIFISRPNSELDRAVFSLYMPYDTRVLCHRSVLSGMSRRKVRGADPTVGLIAYVIDHFVLVLALTSSCASEQVTSKHRNFFFKKWRLYCETQSTHKMANNCVTELWHVPAGLNKSQL